MEGGYVFLYSLYFKEKNAGVLEFGGSFFALASWGGRRYLPYAFTEQGIAMLSSVLNSERAIDVNVAIMRTFVKLRELMITHQDLARKIEQLEEKFKKHDENFVVVFQTIRKLLETPQEPKKKKLPIGFHVR